VAFRLKPDESLKKGIRRIFRREIEKALEELESCGFGDDEVVHGVRKRIKKLRAVLRLIRADLGKKTFRHANVWLRDAARPLTEMRDAKVLLDALDKLAPRIRDETSPESVVAVRTFLMNHKETVAHHVLDEESACSRVQSMLGDARDRLNSWMIVDGGWATIDAGLQRAYRAGYGALAVASTEPTIENLHEWRKQAKYFGYQLQLLEPICRNVMDELGNPVQELTEVLGDDHDLTMLEKTVTEEAADLGGDGAVSRLRELIDRRRSELQKSAFEMGRQIYHDGPRTTMDRIQAWRRTWQRELANGRVAVAAH
jgi:CHAD domain-containing protein